MGVGHLQRGAGCLEEEYMPTRKSPKLCQPPVTGPE